MFYDSMLKYPGFELRKPLLDSIIAYKQFYKDSTLKLLQNAFYNRAFDLDDASQYYLAKEDFETVLSMGASIGFKSFTQEFLSINRLANILNMLGDIKQSLLLVSFYNWIVQTWRCSGTRVLPTLALRSFASR